MLKKGDKVKATEAAYKNGLFRLHVSKDVTGIVVSNPKKYSQTVRVIKTGVSTALVYHKSFWELA